MPLPYDQACPVIYDNDAVCDVYTDDYLMVLAGAGDIQLAGMVSSSSVVPFNKYVPTEDYESAKPPAANVLNMVANRARGVELARASGLANLPDPVRGIMGNLERPSSGDVNDTQPIGSDGTSLVVQQARKASPSRPLVLVMGGPLTLAADAYLTDRTIADKMIVAWLGGRMEDMADYNGWADPWAATVVIQKLRLVQFPADKWDPEVPKARLPELADTPLRRWMMDKDCPTNVLPDGRDADAQPAIALMRTDYVLDTRTISFSHLMAWNGHDMPAFKDDPNGTAIVVTNADRDIATAEWWRAMKNPKLW